MTITTRAPAAPPAPTRRQPGTGASPASTQPAAPAMEVAPVGRRVAAFVVDLVVTALVVVGVYLATGELLYAALALVEVPVALCVWEARSGLTVGNALLRIRTVRADGPFAPGIGRSTVRGLVVLAGFLVAAVGQFVVVASGAWDRSPLKQGWHDALARTTMIDVSRRSTSRRAAGRSAQGADPVVGARPPVFHGPVVTAPEVPSGRADLAAPPAPSLARQATGAPVALAPVRSAPALPAAPVPAAPAPPAPAPAPPAESAPTRRTLAHRAPTTPLPPPPAASPVRSVPTSDGPHPVPVWAPPPASVPAGRPATTGPAPQAPARRAETVGFLLSFDNGQSFTVHGSGLVGRKPQSAPGEQHDDLLAVDDENRSLSKTHLEFGIDEGGFWVTDRGSTNGTSVLTAHGEPLDVLVGVRIHVPGDGSVRVGRRQFTARPLAR